jgi:hypothetical protein
MSVTQLGRMDALAAEYLLLNITILYDYPDIEWLYMVFRPIKYQRIYETDANNGIVT